MSGGPPWTPLEGLEQVSRCGLLHAFQSGTLDSFKLKQNKDFFIVNRLAESSSKRIK
jgi:hypothetical protein